MDEYVSVYLGRHIAVEIAGYVNIFTGIIIKPKVN